MQSILHKIIGPAEPTLSRLDGKIAIVTGGALGIGFEISRALAHAGAKVIMVNRKEDQGRSAIEKITSETPEAQVDWVGCDLGRLSEVRSVFTKLRADLGRLDYLVLSAGINANQFGLDADGIDRHFGVNVLGHFCTVNQLWPLLRRTSRERGEPPRVVFEASEMHRLAPSDVRFESLAELNNPDMDPTQLYGRTKLALILLAKFGLKERVIDASKDNILALSVHPGAVNTAMQQQWKDAYPGITGVLISWASQAFGRDVEQGSYSALWALTAPEIIENEWNGWYFTDPGQPGKESKQASDPELGAALWNLCENIVKEKLGQDGLVKWDD